jgi:hypothetical protein
MKSVKLTLTLEITDEFFESELFQNFKAEVTSSDYKESFLETEGVESVEVTLEY